MELDHASILKHLTKLGKCGFVGNFNHMRADEVGAIVKAKARVSFDITSILSRGRDAHVYKLENFSANIIAPTYDLVIKIIKRTHTINRITEKMLCVNHIHIERMFMVGYFIGGSFNICERLDETLHEQLFSDGGLCHPREYIIDNILSGLYYLHTSLRMAHCDLKENNIMYSRADKCFKLIDFNNGNLESTFKTFPLATTAQKVSMRLLADRHDWGYDVDLWSTAMIYFFITFKHYMTDSVEEQIEDYEFDDNVCNKMQQNFARYIEDYKKSFDSATIATDDYFSIKMYLLMTTDTLESFLDKLNKIKSKQIRR